MTKLFYAAVCVMIAAGAVKGQNKNSITLINKDALSKGARQASDPGSIWIRMLDDTIPCMYRGKKVTVVFHWKYVGDECKCANEFAIPVKMWDEKGEIKINKKTKFL